MDVDLNFRSGIPCRDLQACKVSRSTPSHRYNNTRSPFQHLYIDLQKKTQSLVDFSTEVLETELQQVINDPHSDRLVLEMACKIYFLLLAKKYNQIDLKAVLNLKSPRASNYIVRGILCTRYDFANHDLLYCIIMTAVETCLKDNSVYTTIALNNLRLFCNNYKNFPFDFSELWRLVALHLSSRFIGAREEALSILEFIVKFDPKYGQEIARLVSSQWPWTYSNKFYVLCTVIEGSHSAAALLSPLGLDDDDLVEGLLMGLKYPTLYTSGQLLFRSLLRKDQLEVVTRFMVEMVSRNDTQLLHNFHVQWSKEILQFKEEIYPSIEQLIEGVEEQNRVLLMNVFRDQLVLEENVLPGVDGSTDPVVKQHFYEILLHRIGKEMNLPTDLRRMIEFLMDMKQEDNTTLRQYLFATYPHLITGLIRVYVAPKCPGETAKVIESFFKALNDEIIVDGFMASDPDYPEIILSIRLYHILMRTLHSQQKSIKAMNLQESFQFKGILEEKNLFNGISQAFFKHLLHQLNSPYDDIRLLASNIVLQFFPATGERRKCIEEMFCEKMYFSSMDDSRRIHGYFKVLVPYYEALRLDIQLLLYNEYKKHLVDNFRDHFGLDPLKSINCGIQVFDKINILQEIVLSKKVAKEELLPLMELLKEISTRMLHFLSLAQKQEEDITPSFQVIEESLQILVNNTGRRAESEWDFRLDKSAMEREKNMTKRKDLLLAIWMTLKVRGSVF